MSNKEKYMKLTNYLKSNGKLLYSWGSANGNRQFVDIQTSVGMNGIITDR